MRESASPEIWGGLECSVVRIGDAVRNQIVDTGHDARAADLDLIAGTGIRSLRYPVLWETIGSAAGNERWAWHDARFRRLRELGIAPIAGLVHHGSGPPDCDILNPHFPDALADHAAEVARRYPWINLFTPVNEPMTTARLCGLYGHWHPHGRTEAACLRIVVAECRAIATAMAAIRRLNPEARLVQTEDIGKVFSTPLLSYQADHENERRWLALDLLVGRVDRHHPFHGRLLEAGIDERHLAELVDAPCPPDIIGIDQYLTSDRFLDERLEDHPKADWGGNGRHAYADIAAVRVDLAPDALGFLPRLRETWDRFGLPVALTEVHNGCTREEQLRWLIEGWTAANEARMAGVDVRAVAVWSLLGASDWNSLLTRREGHYEPGAFDARFAPPRATVIARAVRKLVADGHFDHPALDRAGWWQSDERCAERPFRPLVLAGDRIPDEFEARCQVRRLDFVCVDRHVTVPPELGAWAVIQAETVPRAGRGDGVAENLRLTCRYISPQQAATCQSLEIEASSEFDPVHVIDAFLDQVIDGAVGRLQVTQAGPGNQYTFRPLQAGASRKAADRPAHPSMAEA
jgi:beta-glucosidase/6-phospho-beta-glucosidase/beta-galactosidase